MGIINDVKEGWRAGRDWNKTNRNLKKGYDEYERTVDMLNSELDTDERYGNALSDREMRVHDELVTPHMTDFLNKHPNGRDTGKGLGIVSEMIAERLPRKRKIVKIKPKRKPIKKKVVKKCKCK